MKTTMLIVLALSQMLVIGCGEEAVAPALPDASVTAQINALPVESLSQQELTSIILMREEEKLAHDVYSTLYQKWGMKIFNNIASSEETHTGAVLALLVKYGIEDPVQQNGIGEFQNEDLQNLYKDLVEKGLISLTDALTVGATIEDLDLLDLKNALTGIDNQDIIYVYNNLSKGSRNHLRSFYSQLSTQNNIYEAQYITQQELEEIIATPKETGSW